MLLLTRKIGERIIIADDIIVTVVELGEGRVKLGITADASVSIHREEVQDQIDRERRDRPA